MRNHFNYFAPAILVFWLCEQLTMDENSQEMYLQNLEEFVLDEDKIVTYKWLSKTLNIHVNQSKQLLYTFCKDKQASVSATYLLAGRLRSTGESQITVVGQDKYEDAKSSFETLSSEHVYSIQKTKQTPSGSILFTADSQPVDGDCTASRGAIRCQDSVRRAAEELALLRVTVPPPAPATVSKPAKAGPSTSKEPEKKSPAKAKPAEAEKEEVNKESKPKGGLAAMFAAQTSKAPAKAASGAASSKNNAKGKKGAGISNFFSKVSKEEMEENDKAEKAKAEKAKAIKEKEASPAKVEKEEVMDVDSDEESKPSSPPVTAKQGNKKTDSESKSKTKNSSKPSKPTKRSKTKEKKDEPKKRKRIVTHDSDSSDADIFEEEKNPSSREASPEPVLRAKALESDEDEDIIPPTPDAETSNGRVRRRRKVTKDKTFLDENGYMVTQKVNEYESFSESDTENADSKRSKGPSKPAEKVEKESPPSASKGKSAKGKAPAKKASPVPSKSPLKSKQQSLMSFFKKKD